MFLAIDRRTTIRHLPTVARELQTLGDGPMARFHRQPRLARRPISPSRNRKNPESQQQGVRLNRPAWLTASGRFGAETEQPSLKPKYGTGQSGSPIARYAVQKETPCRRAGKYTMICTEIEGDLCDLERLILRVVLDSSASLTRCHARLGVLPLPHGRAPAANFAAFSVRRPTGTRRSRCPATPVPSIISR